MFYGGLSRGVDCFDCKVGWPVGGTYNENDFNV